MRLLARREHSRRELARKLAQRHFSVDDIDAVLATLTGAGLLSDERFAECYIDTRAARGYGPVRIAVELRERGVDGALIEQCLVASEHHWDDVLHAVSRKKFGVAPAEDFPERARRARFLQYRGFTSEQIKTVLDTD